MIRKSFLGFLGALLVAAAPALATLQTFPMAVIPPWHPLMSGPPTFGFVTLDASGEKAAAVFYAPKTGTVSKIGWRTSTVTTGATVDVRLETVDTTTGDPSGTLFGTNTNGSQVVDSANDNTWFTTTLTAGASVTQGDLLAVVIVWGTGGNLQVTHYSDDFGGESYPDHFTSAWAKQQAAPVVAVEYSDGSYAYGPTVYPYAAITTGGGYASNSTPDEQGLYFSFPYPVTVAGAWMVADLDGAADLILYDADGSSTLRSLSFDSDVRQTTTNLVLKRKFTSPVTLTANTSYRLVLKPTTTTLIVLPNFDVNSAAVMGAFEGGQDFHFTSRTDEGSWSQTTTRRPMMGLMIEAFDDGTGGGGGGEPVHLYP